jgi:hypothetical protein
MRGLFIQAYGGPLSVTSSAGGRACLSLWYPTVLAIKAPRAGGDARARRTRIASLDGCVPVGRAGPGQSRLEETQNREHRKPRD